MVRKEGSNEMSMEGGWEQRLPMPIKVIIYSDLPLESKHLNSHALPMSSCGKSTKECQTLPQTCERRTRECQTPRWERSNKECQTSPCRKSTKDSQTTACERRTTNCQTDLDTACNAIGISHDRKSCAKACCVPTKDTDRKRDTLENYQRPNCTLPSGKNTVCADNWWKREAAAGEQRKPPEFPFVGRTPSGNFKVHPDMISYENKEFGILVANPQCVQTTVKKLSSCKSFSPIKGLERGSWQQNPSDNSDKYREFSPSEKDPCYYLAHSVRQHSHTSCHPNSSLRRSSFYEGYQTPRGVSPPRHNPHHAANDNFTSENYYHHRFDYSTYPPYPEHPHRHENYADVLQAKRKVREMSVSEDDRMHTSHNHQGHADSWNYVNSKYAPNVNERGEGRYSHGERRRDSVDEAKRVEKHEERRSSNSHDQETAVNEAKRPEKQERKRIFNSHDQGTDTIGLKQLQQVHNFLENTNLEEQYKAGVNTWKEMNEMKDKYQRYYDEAAKFTQDYQQPTGNKNDGRDKENEKPNLEIPAHSHSPESIPLTAQDTIFKIVQDEPMQHPSPVTPSEPSSRPEPPPIPPPFSPPSPPPPPPRDIANVNEPSKPPPTSPTEIMSTDEFSKTAESRSVQGRRSPTLTQDEIKNPKVLENLDTVKDVVLIFGGNNPKIPLGTGNSGRSVYMYAMETNKWTRVGVLPSPRAHSGLARVGNHVFLIGGTDPEQKDKNGKNIPVSTVFRLDLRSGRWEKVAELDKARSHFGCAAIDHIIYIIGGNVDGRASSTCLAYSTVAHSTKPIASLAITRSNMGIAVIGGEIMIAGGSTKEADRPVLDTVTCYDPQKDRWTPWTNLPSPIAFCSLIPVNKEIYLVAGAGMKDIAKRGNSSLPDILCYNDGNDEWDVVGMLSTPRHGHAAVRLGDSIIVIGGVSSYTMGALDSVEVFSATNRMTKMVKHLSHSKCGVSALVL